MSTTIVGDADVFPTVNNGSSTLSANINDAQTTISVVSGADFESSGGYAWIVSTNGSTPGEELIKYTGVSGNTLTGVTRGVGGTTPVNADSADIVEIRVTAEMHNAVGNMIKTLSNQMRSLATAGLDFYALSLSDSTGTVENGFLFEIDTADGTIVWTLDTGNLGADFNIIGGTGTAQVDLMRWVTDGTELAAAFDTVKFYTAGGLDVGGSLWADFDPDVADGAGVVAFALDTQNDLANATANLFQISNNGTVKFAVRKAETEAPKFVASGGDAFMNVPVLAADPTSPANGDIWLRDFGGVRTIRVRISGVTYSTTLT